MSEKKLKFFDIVKLIHPDLNPDIQNPEVKMDQVTTNRNDEEELYRLAVIWGLIDDPDFEETSIEYVIDPGKIVKVDDKHEGIIIDVLNKGEYIDVVVWINGTFNRFKRKNIEDQNSAFVVLGHADEDEYNKLDYRYQMNYTERQDG